MRDADVIHVHGLLNATSTLGARIAIHGRRPVVIGPFGTMSRYTFSYRRSLAKRLYFALADEPNLRRASAIHFTTAAEREDAAWHGLETSGRTFIVPPPYDTTTADTMTRMIEPDRPIVLFLGRLHPVKGVEVLLEAWGTVRASYPTAELRVAGTGTARYTAFLQERARALGHDGTVRFLGFVADGDKRRELSDASVLALPSRHENFGIAVLDAIASGVPVIVGTGVQLAPWVEANHVGRVVDRAPESVGRAIVGALADQALRARVAGSGRAIVERAFGPEAVAPALEAMYRGALRNAGRAA
jgi:glycosyltransferase involved in cell wall biosynthesis